MTLYYFPKLFTVMSNVIGCHSCAEYIALYVMGVSSLKNTFGGTCYIFISVTDSHMSKVMQLVHDEF